MNRLLGAILRGVGILLYHLGLPGTVIRLRPRSVRILLYHDCEPQESDFTAGLHSTTTPAHFAAHLDYYARHYQVIPLTRIESGDIPDRAAVITFDDGYHSVLRNAVPLLGAHAMPATVYLVTTVVGNQRLVWVNEMNWLLRRHGEAARPVLARLTGLPPSASPTEQLIAARLRCAPSEIESALAEINRIAGLDRARVAAEARLYLDWDEVRALMPLGLNFGNHTATHPSLPRLSPGEQRREMALAWEALEREGCQPGQLAYPFGDHTEASRTAAAGLGCTSIAEVGLVQGPLNLQRLGRVPADGIAGEAELFAQVEVVEPVKAWLKGLARRLRRRTPGPDR